MFSADRQFAGFLLSGVACTLIAGCGAESGPPPQVAESAPITLAEDTHADSRLIATHAGAEPLKYVLITLPSHGTVTLDPSSGDYRYTPAPDYFGNDEFAFKAVTGKRSSGKAIARFEVTAVDDAPVLSALPNLASGGDQWKVSFSAHGADADHEALTYSSISDNESVATVEIDPLTGAAIIEPRAAGNAQITVVASDGHTQVRRDFQFASAPVRVTRSVKLTSPEYSAIGIFNSADVDVSFTLRINDRLFLASRTEILNDALSSPSGIRRDDDIARLWAYVRSETMHFSSLTDALWAHDPELLINSIGFGMCDDRTMALVYLAQLLEIPARTWDLEGHVIPEFFVNGHWEAWDADYGVVYFDESGNVAALADLEARPELITSPIDPVISAPTSPAYGADLAQLYASSGDNRIVDYFYMKPVAAHSFTINLPPGGRLTIGGQYGPTPRTYLGKPAYFFASAVLELPPGTTGKHLTGLVPNAVQGIGKVRIGESGAVEIGSLAMAAALRYRDAFPGDVDFTETQSDVVVSYLVNPLAVQFRKSNEVVIEGHNAGALRLELRRLNGDRSKEPHLEN